MNTIATRLAAPGDVEALAPLFDAYRRFYGQTADIALALRFVRNRIEQGESIVLLAEDRNRDALGFCQMYPSFCSVAAAPICILYDLFVAPAARRSGAGRSLLRAAELHAAANGFERLELTTAKTNLPAQSLYESLGWVRDEIYHTYSKTIRD